MRYRHFVIKKFINTLIVRGNKFKALNYFCFILELLKKKKFDSSLMYLIYSLAEIKPTVSIKRVKRGSKYVYLPKLLTVENQYKQAISWLIKLAKQNKQNDIAINITDEILLILKKKGELIKKKEKVYSLLLDSRPFLYLIKYN